MANVKYCYQGFCTHVMLSYPYICKLIYVGFICKAVWSSLNDHSCMCSSMKWFPFHNFVPSDIDGCNTIPEWLRIIVSSNHSLPSVSNTCNHEYVYVRGDNSYSKTPAKPSTIGSYENIVIFQFYYNFVVDVQVLFCTMFMLWGHGAFFEEFIIKVFT